MIKDNHQLSDPYRRILGCLLILKIDSKAYLEGVKATIDKQDFLVQPALDKALYDVAIIIIAKNVYTRSEGMQYHLEM